MSNLPTINDWINLKSLLFNALNAGNNKNKIKENWKYPFIKSIALDVYFKPLNLKNQKLCTLTKE